MAKESPPLTTIVLTHEQAKLAKKNDFDDRPEITYLDPIGTSRRIEDYLRKYNLLWRLKLACFLVMIVILTFGIYMIVTTSH
ncbi:hypothetical protein LJR234_003627 [Mesorhizobium amorphae]|uniref:hypothetical protein n=1 Tax=Mesorhizobium amorphae TaxID=71433 RepID=UPI003ECD0781